MDTQNTHNPQEKERYKGRLLMKMTIFMSFIALTSLVIAAFSIREFNNLHQSEVEARQLDVLQKIEEDVVGRMRFLYSLLISQNHKLTDNLTSFENGAPTYDTLSRQQYTDRLDFILQTAPEIEALRLVDTSGKVVALSTRNADALEEVDYLRDLSGLDYFNRASVDGTDFTDPRVFTTLRGPMFNAAFPVFGSTEEIPGALIATINIKTLMQSIVIDNKIDRAGYIYITDKWGRLLLHSEPDIPPISLEHIEIVASTILQGELATEGQKRYTGVNNQMVVGSVMSFTKPPLHIFIELPTDEADEIFHILIARFTWITGLVLLLTGLFAFYLAYIIVKPIQELERGAARVAEGELENPVDIHTGDEIEELGESFNDMMKGLKRLQELRDEFVFVAAHELRTPVTAIKGYVEMILDGSAGQVSEQAQNFLTKVQTSSDRLNQLVEDLLEVARSEAGRLEIEVEPTKLATPIQEVVDELQPLADEKQLEVTYEHTDVPTVMADAKRVKEVMVNLVGNSIKYTPEGWVKISHDVKDGMLITRVSDSGLGMSEEDRAKLFEKFYRIQTEMTVDIPGTGLGLFITKEIIEKMHGEIWVDSEVGKGSTFSFSLPLANDADIAAAEAEHAEEQHAS